MGNRPIGRSEHHCPYVVGQVHLPRVFKSLVERIIIQTFAETFDLLDPNTTAWKVGGIESDASDLSLPASISR